MDTIEINVAVDSSPVFAAINAFEQLEAKIVALSANAVQAFTTMQAQLAAAANAIQAPQEQLGVFNNSLKQTAIDLLSVAASSVQLSATNTALGAALKLLGGAYLFFEKVLGGVFRGVLGFSKLMGRLSVLLASGALQAVLALGKGLLVFGKTAAVIGKSLLTNPIFWIGATLAAAAAAVIVNWDNIVGLFEDLKKKLQPIFDDIKAVIKAVVDTVLGFVRVFVDAYKPIFDAIKKIADSILGVFDNIDLIESGRRIITTLIDGIKAMGGFLVDSIKEAFGAAARLLPFSDAKEGPFSQLTYNGGAIMTTLAEGVEGKQGVLSNAVETGLEKAEDKIGVFQQRLRDSFAELGKSVAGVFENAINGLVSGGNINFSGLVSQLSGALQQFGQQSVSSGASSIFQSITSGLGNIGSSLLSSAGGILSSLGGVASSVLSSLGGIGSAISSAVSGISSFLGATGLAAGLPGLIAGGLALGINAIIDRNNKPRAETFLKTSGGRLDSTGILTDNGGTPENVQKILSSVTQFVNTVLDDSGATLNDGSAFNGRNARILEKKGQIYVRFNGRSGDFGNNLGAAAGFLAKQILSADLVEGLSPSIRTVIQNTGNDLEALANNIQFAQIYDRVIQESNFEAKATGAITQAYHSIVSQFTALAEQASTLGLAVQPLLEAQQRAIGKLREEFLVGVSNEILSITGQGGVLQLQALLKSQQARLDDAAILNLNPTELAELERLSLLERQKLLENFSVDAIASLLPLLTLQEQLAFSAAIASREISLQIENTQALIQGYQKAGEGIDKLLQSFVLGNNSQLSRVDQLSVAREQFNTVRDSALAGNIDALNQLPSVAQTFLTLSRQVNASGSVFQGDFQVVEQALIHAQNAVGSQVSLLESEQSLLRSIQQTLAMADPNTDILQAQLTTLQSINTALVGENIVPISNGQVVGNNNIITGLLSGIINAQQSGNDTQLSAILTQLQQGTDTQTEENVQLWQAITTVATELQTQTSQNEELRDQLSLLLAQAA